jgi:hypothetical protein
MSAKKSKHNATSLGVAFSTVTRAKLDLLAASLDRPIGWVVRDAVGSYLAGNAFAEERARFPQLAKALDAAIVANGGDMDEIYGLNEPAAPAIDQITSGLQVVAPAMKHVSPTIEPMSPAIDRVVSAISQVDEPVQAGDPRPASGLLGA